MLIVDTYFVQRTQAARTNLCDTVYKADILCDTVHKVGTLCDKMHKFKIIIKKPIFIKSTIVKISLQIKIENY